MKQSECLYEIARRIRKYGFASESNNEIEYPSPRCFYGHKWQMPIQGYRDIPILNEVIGVGPIFTKTLIEGGWTDGCNDDAAAACEIAGDIAFEQERTA